MYARRFVLVLAALCLCAAANAQTDLSVVLPESVTQQFSVNKNIKQTLTIAGNDITSEVDDHALLEAKYGKRTNGLHSIEYRYAGWQADVDVNGDKVRFDAANPKEGGSDSPIAVVLDGYRRMAKLPFKLTMDENGRVTQLQGWEEILDGLDDKSKVLHQEMFETTYLQDFWTAEFQRLPNRPVEKDETWQQDVEVRFHGGQSMTFTTLYRYVGPVEIDGRSLEKIDVKTTHVKYQMLAAADAPLVVSDSDLKVTESTGVLLFDPARRQVSQVKELLRIQGDLTFKVTASEKELPGKLDLHLQSEQTLLP